MPRRNRDKANDSATNKRRTFVVVYAAYLGYLIAMLGRTYLPPLSILALSIAGFTGSLNAAAQTQSAGTDAVHREKGVATLATEATAPDDDSELVNDVDGDLTAASKLSSSVEHSAPDSSIRMNFIMDLNLMEDEGAIEDPSKFSSMDFVDLPDSPEVVQLYNRLAAYESSDATQSMFDFDAIAGTARVERGLGSVLRSFARRIEQRQDIDFEGLRREYLSTGLNGETAKYLAGVAAPRW